MTKTKIIGWLMFVISMSSLGIDVLDGNGLNLYNHLLQIFGALNGLGFVFARSAIQKLEALLKEIQGGR